MSLNINLVAEAQVPANDRTFLQKVFALVSKANKKELIKEKDPLVVAVREEYNSLSWRADRVRIQESCSIRNVMRAREIAIHLIDDEGKLDLTQLDVAIVALEKYLYPLGPARTFDAERQEWMLEALKRLRQSNELQRLLRNIHVPHANIIAAEMIRDTLNLADNHTLHNSDARRAALAAWLTYLRQSVGSCFATAPTIIIHQEQSEQFFKDLADLLSIGQLKRTFGGKEYSAPLSPSWGAGDIKKPFLLGTREDQEGAIDFWLSPGLLTALEKVEIIDSAKPIRTRIARAKSLIIAIVEKIAGSQRHMVTSAEEVLSHLLMNHLSITEQDIEDQNRRSVPMAGFLQGSQTQTTGHKSALVKKYFQMKKEVEASFKSLADSALLKAWEFTVASFAETKPTFTRWNLYAALGFNSDQEGGIAESIFTIAQEKLSRQNAEVQEHQDHYDSMYPIIRGLETRLRTASTEKEIQWLKSDYQNKVYEFRRIEELRDEAHQKARWWANVGSMILSYYDMLFPQYFQEVYDADMLDVGPNPYDDSPAGFRLLYKWGRTNTSQWTRIQSADDFIEALANFFTITERELGNYAEFAGRDRELSELISDIVRKVRSREFLESAFDRMADAHQVPRVEDPLNNLEKISKKPWVYTSGGSMNSLIGCYWKREAKLTEVEKWMESATELFIFILDTLKETPNNILELYQENKSKSMLIHSPSHAFLLKPGLPDVRKGWENKDFTYTWVRDKTILPKDHFISSIQLDASQMEFLTDLIAEDLPASYRHYFRRVCANVWGTATPKLFRDEIFRKVQGEPGLQYHGQPIISEEMVDSALYTHLPLTSIEVIENKIEAIVSPLPGMEKIPKNDLRDLLDQIRKSLIGNRWVSAKQLNNICCAVVLLCLNDTAFAHDYHQLIVENARKENAMLPKPVIFADTNWVKDKFSFVVNPGTLELELWRTDRLGAIGAPMAEWQEWLNGRRKDRKWGIYSRPHEYVFLEHQRFIPH
jgi:hypothetical protein